MALDLGVTTLKSLLRDFAQLKYSKRKIGVTLAIVVCS